MAQKNIKDIRSIIFGSLSDLNLGRALAQLKIIASPAVAQDIAGIESTYCMMLSYVFDGVEDPDRDNIFNHLIKRTYELADDICAGYMPTDYSQNEVFSKLWNCYRFVDEQTSYCRELNDNGNELDTSIAVSAITLSCLRILDEPKLLCLIDFCYSKFKKTAARAMVGLVLCLVKHNRRIVYYPAVNNRLNLLFNDTANVDAAREIVRQFIRCKETPRITKDIRENIMPTLSKFTPDIKKSMQNGNFDSEEYEESSYNLQDMIQESGIAEKMQAYSELQMQGSDINMSTFSQLKNFAFFQHVDGWFMPFYKENPVVSALFSNADEGSFLDFMVDSNFLCDSDKYSFCINLAMVPEEYRKSMASQLKNESAQMDEVAGRPEDMKAYTNRYMQDIYRFFKLYRNKEYFDDIFDLRCDVHNMGFFRFLNQDGEFLAPLADFYMAKEQYDNALGAYRMLEENCEPDADLYRKIAFCLQKGLYFTQAAEYYEKVDLMDGGKPGILKKLAYCYRKAGNFDKALDYYRQAESLDGENLNILYNIGCCLAETGQYEKALNYFYKIDFLNPDVRQSVNFHLYYGHCLWATGDRKGAIRRYMMFTPKDKLEDNLRLAPCKFSERDIFFILDYIRYSE